MLNMLKRMSAGWIIIFAGILALVAFFAWLGFLFFLWFGLGARQIGGDFWGAVEGLSGAATLASVFGGGVIALVQLVESVESRQREIESRNLDIYDSTFERLTSDANIEARRWIYMNLNLEMTPEEGVRIISQDPVGQSSVKLVLNSFDHLGFLIQNDLVNDDAIIEWVSPFVVKVWERLGPYIDYEARRRNEPDYYEAVRYLAERCMEVRAKRFGRENRSNYVQDAI